MDKFLSTVMVMLAGVGLINVPTADMYEHPRVFFGLPLY